MIIPKIKTSYQVPYPQIQAEKDNEILLLRAHKKYVVTFAEDTAEAEVVEAVDDTSCRMFEPRSVERLMRNYNKLRKQLNQESLMIDLYY